MNLLGICDYEKLDSTEDRVYYKSPCECGIEPMSFIGHIVG